MKIYLFLLALICPFVASQNDPPPFWQHANMARYILNQADWTTVATISSRSPTESYPFANVFSVSDGATVEDSTGIPYFYVTPLDISVIDFEADDRVSMALTLEQTGYCDEKHWDPEDPRCPHAIYTGRMVPLEEGSAEEDFAREALFTRHPAMVTWPHDMYFCKIEIENIILLDMFGSSKTVDVDEYFAADASGVEPEPTEPITETSTTAQPDDEPTTTNAGSSQYAEMTAYSLIGFILCHML